MRWDKFFDGFFSWLGRLTALVIVTVSSWSFTMHILSSDKYVYCQIEGSRQYNGRYDLQGVRDWSPDEAIGTFNNIDDAKLVASKIECPLR